MKNQIILPDKYYTMNTYSIDELLLKKDIPEITSSKFKEVLNGGVYANRYLQTLTEKQKKQLKSLISEWLDIWFTKQIQFQLLCAKLSGVSENETRQEYNHKNIQEYIRKYVMRNRLMPSAPTIAEALKINVKTVRKHLAASQNSVEGMFEDYSLMARDIMGTLAGVALSECDVRAAKVYMDSMEKMKKNRAQPTQVQLKNLVITQPIIDSLTAEQQDGIIDLLSGIIETESEEVQTAIDVAEEIIPISETGEEIQTAIEAAEKIKPATKTGKKTQKAIKATEEIKPITETPTNQFAPVKISEGGGKLFE